MIEVIELFNIKPGERFHGAMIVSVEVQIGLRYSFNALKVRYTLVKHGLKADNTEIVKLAEEGEMETVLAGYIKETEEELDAMIITLREYARECIKEVAANAELEAKAE